MFFVPQISLSERLNTRSRTCTSRSPSLLSQHAGGRADTTERRVGPAASTTSRHAQRYSKAGDSKGNVRLLDKMPTRLGWSAPLQCCQHGVLIFVPLASHKHPIIYLPTSTYDPAKWKEIKTIDKNKNEIYVA